MRILKNNSNNSNYIILQIRRMAKNTKQIKLDVNMSPVRSRSPSMEIG